MVNQAPADAYAPEGVVSRSSAFTFIETTKRIQKALARNGFRLYALIDHSADATGVGVAMPEAIVLIFGKPEAGAPLMVASPLLALDLPLKALVWQDTARQVWVSYLSPAWLAQRYHIPADLARNIAGMEPLIAAAIQR